MSAITAHENWPLLLPYLRADCSKRPGPWRLEVDRPESLALIGKFLAMRAQCVACGTFMSPVRSRPDGSLRLAVACPHDVNEGCSKGRAASEEVERIAGLIQGAVAAGGQGGFDWE